MEISLKIDGMHCGGCASAVQRVLSRVDAVTAVSVDLGAGRARVTASKPVDLAVLTTAVEDAGYAARAED